MKISSIHFSFFAVLLSANTLSLSAQNVPDTTATASPRFTLETYGDANCRRDNEGGIWRNTEETNAVLIMGCDFGQGWALGLETGFARGSSKGATAESHNELTLSELWVEKSFSPQLNLRVGHYVVPVAYVNYIGTTFDYFSTAPSEAEAVLMPFASNQTGVSLFGEHGAWSYRLQLLADFSAANRYGAAVRADNTAFSGLRLGLSGYAGSGGRYVGAVDFTLDRAHWLVRGNADYVWNGAGGFTAALEAGYDFFSLLNNRPARQKFYAFGRYEYARTAAGMPEENSLPETSRFTVGVNYEPLPQVRFKAEYARRLQAGAHGDASCLAVGVAFCGVIF